MKVLKVTSSSGVYVTRNLETPYGQDVRSYEFLEMSEEEYNELPETDEAKRFFQGKLIAQRAD